MKKIIIFSSLLCFCLMSVFCSAFIFRDPSISANDDGTDIYASATQEPVSLYDISDPTLYGQEDEGLVGDIKDLGGIIMSMLSPVTSSAGDAFLTWNQQGNPGYDVSSYQGVTLNKIINPVTTGYDINYAISNQYENAHNNGYGFDSVIGIIDSNNKTAIISLYRASDGSGIRIKYLNGTLIKLITMPASEDIMTGGIIFNPWLNTGDNVDKLIFSTDQNIRIYNLSLSQNFPLQQIYNINLSGYDYLNTMNFGCNWPYDDKARCFFMSNTGDHMNQTLNYSVISNTLTINTLGPSTVGCDPTTSPLWVPTVWGSYENTYTGTHWIIYPICEDYVSNSPRVYMIDDTKTGIGQWENINMSTLYPGNLRAAQSSMVRAGGTNARGAVIFAATYNSSTGFIAQYHTVFNYNLTVRYGYMEDYYNKNAETGNLTSPWLVGDYTNTGVKYMCYVKSIEGDVQLYCWDSMNSDLNDWGEVISYDYPDDLDPGENSFLMGNFKNNASTQCLANGQGIVCSIVNGGWVEKFNNFGGQSDTNYKLYTPYSDGTSSGIVTNNGKPIFVYDAGSSIDNIEGIDYRVTSTNTGDPNFYYWAYDTNNGFMGTNAQVYDYHDQGLYWWNDFATYWDAPNPNKNIVNVTEAGTPTSVTYNASGAIFDGVNGHGISLGTYNFTGWTSMTVSVTATSYESPGGYKAIFSKTDGSSNKVMNLQKINTEKIRCVYYNTSGDTYYADSTTSMIQYAPYKIDCILNGTKIILYINGVNEANATFTGTFKDSAPTTTWIGGYSGGIEFWNGTISDIKIYNKALVSSEITPPSWLGTGSCTYNSDCLNANYPYCVNGCCYDTYNNTWSPFIDQCNGDAQCTGTPNPYCIPPLNSTFVRTVCGNMPQNATCYFNQLQNAYYTSNNGTCPAPLLSTLPQFPGATCTAYYGTVCSTPTNVGGSGDVCYGADDDTCHYALVPGECTNLGDKCYYDYGDMACYNYPCGALTIYGKSECESAGCSWAESEEYFTGVYGCPSGNVYIVGGAYDPMSSYHDDVSLCEITGNIALPTFTPCLDMESCLNGTCFNTTCNPGVQTCSDGTDFTHEDPAGDVYECNTNGTGFYKLSTCGANQTCVYHSPTFAECQGNLTYYCISNIGCAFGSNTNNTIPNNCYPTLSQCQEAYQIYGQSPPQSADQAGIQNFFNLFLGTSGFGKMMVGMLFIMLAIIGTYVAISYWTPTGTPITPIIPMLSGLFAFIFGVMFGLIPIYLLIVVIIGTIGLWLLFRFMMNPVGDS